MSNEGIVFNIQRFTLHDGPGIRTEFFLKGCPLRCDWCGNPESLKNYIQPGVFTNKCISEEKCGGCKEVCPDKNMLNFKDGKLLSIDNTKCTNCLKCVKECPADAIKQWGKLMSVDECMKEALKDKGFYDRSNGGITVSGGDPILQSNFVTELFKRCKDEEIHTCFESTFYGEWKDVEKILPYTDLIISDLKHMNSMIHKKYTGVDNYKILKNLKKLTEQRKELILRIPIIPNINDDMENIKATADYIITELNNRVRTLQLLSFMHLGEEKYHSLGIPYKMKNVKIDREVFQKNIAKIAIYFNSRGINCLVGTKEKVS
ncbi:MAG: (2S)-3-sulfopropanediol dehydratase activating enzyme [Fusobacteriaceae bacterium]